ncbi:MAG: 4Fe-4S binding protein [Spirochaetales bacterium]|nr:4Fe-4S binding protein [Spirochaetales bacterium]
MPWIDKVLCEMCGICVGNCPVNAISITGDDAAEINMNECIRCGECHDICPAKAVKHDSEKIPERVDDNIEIAQRLLKKCKTRKEQIVYIDKYLRAFTIENKINQMSIEKLEAIKNGLS